MNIEILQKALAADKLTVEQHIEALQAVAEVGLALGQKETVVEEPADIDEEVVQKWTKALLNRMLETVVVSIAVGMDIEASVSDKKSDTIKKILDKQDASE